MANTVAKVDGLLILNDDARKEQLKRVYWKDKMYTDFGGGDFVREATVTEREISPSTSGSTLLQYTVSSDTSYSKEILNRYYSNGVEHIPYESKNIPNGERYKWEGDYFENFEPENILAHIGEEEIAKGDIRNANMYAVRHPEAMQTLGSSRRVASKYLTPSLVNFYQDKSRTDFDFVSINPNIFPYEGIRIDVATGRIPDIPEAATANAIHDYSDAKGRVGAGFSDLMDNVAMAQTAKYFETDRSSKNWKTPEDRYADYSEDVSFKGRVKIDTEPFYEVTYQKTGNYNNGIQTVFDEKDTPETEHSEEEQIFTDSQWDTYIAVNSEKPKSLLSKTNKLFNEHKISTLAGRFHTSINDGRVDSFSNVTDSAVNNQYGNSHGRNLLAKKVKTINGYENPYCRVWTYHHQYDQVSKLIRPFASGDTKVLDENKPYTAKYLDSGNVSDGATYLEDNTVLGKNGFVNIAPKKGTVDAKKCMFSIENLAWKDVPRRGGEGGDGYYISDEQRGPNGGRIMWFPPYDLVFREDTRVDWNSSKFIGRGEPVFTYSNTERSGTLQFAILVDHPSIIDSIPKNNAKEDSEELTEDDILRFFAGCEIPEIPGNEVKKITPEDNSNPEGDNPQTVPNLEKSKCLKFYVYFPNNYSGNMAKTNKGDWNTNGSSDRLWYDYILFGEGTKIPTDPAKVGQGYEMGADGGITPEPFTEGIEVAETNEPWTDGKGTVPGVAYEYRVDFDLRQRLINRDLNANSRGMTFDKSNYVDSKGFSLNLLGNLKDTGDSGATVYSFGDIIASMFKADETKFGGDTLLKNNVNSVSVKSDAELAEVVALFKQVSKIKAVKIKGAATSQDKKNSEMLADRRCRSIQDLLMKFISKDLITSERIDVGDVLGDSTTINSQEAKEQRYAYAEIYYDAPEISGDLVEESDEVQREGGDVKNAALEVVPAQRYETEAEYFNNIKTTDPLIYKNIIKKFKYFSPAFHSISPEGFNARLTFLQQCTRQGHTIEASDMNGFAKTAGNLAFGRMPVCVLRLGDFINTKIIITGMNISYGSNGMQWDLNPEGIGVQPMYAQVSLNIIILGGQSLEGPINRLQNAVTFNYYANTGVYDNRSDRITIDGGVTDAVAADNGEVVRTVRTDNESYNVLDHSTYATSKTTYKHVFTPIPSITRERVYDKK